MSSKKRTIVAAASATMLLAASATPALAAAETAVDPQPDQSAERVVGQSGAYGMVEADAVQGTFSWDQGTLTPNSVIKTVFARATSALCNAKSDFIEANPLEWRIAVSGDVANAYVATVDELASEESVQQVMTCSCGGNPSDGRAIITAEVKGLPIQYLIERAGAAPGVNTVTFVSSDGTELAMPYAYVRGHHAVLSYDINGEDLSASVGGNNQLWLVGTSANYFVRDVVEIRVSKESELPPIPGTDMDYPNSPNVGILSSTLG